MQRMLNAPLLNKSINLLKKHSPNYKIPNMTLCKYLPFIFFFNRGHTMNQTTRAVSRAQPNEISRVPHHGNLSNPNTVE